MTAPQKQDHTRVILPVLPPRPPTWRLPPGSAEALERKGHRPMSRLP